MLDAILPGSYIEEVYVLKPLVTPFVLQRRGNTSRLASFHHESLKC